MLHLKFALNLENLADQMIDEISSVWKNPFEAPVVIFPDPKQSSAKTLFGNAFECHYGVSVASGRKRQI